MFAGGGFGAGRYFAWCYSSAHRKAFPDIVHLEVVNLLVTYKTLARFIREPGVLVVIFTDNMGSSLALETGRTKDDILAKCSREMWLEAASNNHQVSIRHKPGSALILADALSRQYKEPAKAAIVQELVLQHNLVPTVPTLNNHVFFDISL